MAAKTPAQWKTLFENEPFHRENYYTGPLGPDYTPGGTCLRLWAPTAEAVTVTLYHKGDGGAVLGTKPLVRGAQGVWSIWLPGEQHGRYYTFAVTVNGITRETGDPYARAVGVNGVRSMIVDLARTAPSGWERDVRPNIPPAQRAVWEVSVRDFSQDFWQAMRAAEPELVILDVMLPGEDGFSILKKLRNTPSLRKLPIIMVTAKSSELDTVRGLDCGADDYIAKPFGIMEFLSRVRVALRRSAPEVRPDVLVFHEIQLDNARHSVTVNSTPVELTYKEYCLLRLLLENTSLVVTRETILQVVWGTDISVESRTVDMHIRTLRKKLGDAGRYICTVRKVGYKLTDEETEEE